MKPLLHAWLVLVLLVLPSASAARAQNTVYVAPDGSALGSGSITSPVGSVETALTRVAPGDTIYVRGGAYVSPASIRIDESGEEGAYICPGETPVFDFTGAPRGFDIRGDYLHLKGLVAEHADDNGVYVKQASYNVIEQGATVEDSWAFDNGYNVWNDSDFQGDSNGFKLGHGPGAHVLVS